MDFQKVFTSKQTIIIIISIVSISLFIFIWTKKEIKEINQKTIEQEIEIQKSVGVLLLQLRSTLKSDKSKEDKIRESFGIIADIRVVLDRDYKNLKTESQKGVDRIKEKLSKIEQKILEDPNSAIDLVDELIDQLSNSNGFADFGNDNKNGNGDNKIDFNNPNYDFDDDDNSNTNNTDTNTNPNTPNTDNNTNPTVEDIFQYKKYKEGVKPKVDRDYSLEKEGETIPYNTKVGN